MSNSGVTAALSFPSALPDNHMVRVFTSMNRLRTAANEVFASLDNKQSTNQWLLVLGLPTTVIKRLDEDRNCLEAIDYRFQWQGRSGLIKVIPTAQHETITTRVMFSVNDALAAMGLHWSDSEWVGHTTYKPNLAKGKQPDNAFLPPSRCTIPLSSTGWPTLVIETGVSESLSQLRADAAKWFADSNGDVRIALVIAIKDSRVDIEKWQLAPEGASPLDLQVPDSQQPYCAQEITITPQGVTGTPLVLPFTALLFEDYDEDVVKSTRTVCLNDDVLTLATSRYGFEGNAGRVDP
ncbi:hypothetical protein CBS147372_2376 [Penicillium roqueforti]|nr:hypothetical protein CBS147372_2376 [Penicillium roqueforti]